MLENHGEDKIGLTLYDKNEAHIVFEYLEWFYNTFTEEEQDSYYINHLKWPEVVDGAKQIVEMMEINNQKYGFIQNMKEWDAMNQGPVI